MSTSVVLWPIARIVRDFLVEQGVAFPYSSTTQWATATAATPKSPADCITLFGEASLKRGHTVAGGVIEDPVCSIHIRSTDPEAGEYRAKLIQMAMDDMSFWIWYGDSDEYGQTIVFQKAYRARGIFPMGKDENGRWLFNLEYSLVVKSIE